MNQPMPLFVLASLLLHGLWLLVPDGSARSPEIGGWQQALQVRVSRPAAVARQPATADPVRPTPARSAPRPSPAPHQARQSRRVAATRPAAARTAIARRHTQPPPVHAAQRLPSPNLAAARARISAALRRRLAAQFDYPWLARRRGWEGQVTLAMRVEDNGRLSNLRVVRTSGHGVLDRSALESARRIGALPEARGWLQHGRSLDLQIPVQYRLFDS